MNAQTHTPGPWFIQPGFLTVYSMSGGDTGLTCAIAGVLDKQPGRDDAEANARLIAAAPELLGALKFVMAFYEPGQSHLDTDAWQAAMAQARAAIAKATGGQP